MIDLGYWVWILFGDSVHFSVVDTEVEALVFLVLEMPTGWLVTFCSIS